jgi:hypothetical protein
MKRATLALILSCLALPALAAPTTLDLSTVRGFNYTTSLDTSIGPRGHANLWLKYDAAQVDRDLDNARRLNLNQVRVFVAYSAWLADPTLFNKNLITFLHSCQAHGIGVMLGLIDEPRPTSAEPAAIADANTKLLPFLEDMLALTAHEPALQFWDAANEPDGGPAANRPVRLAYARAKANLFHALKTTIPVTIGCVHVSCMRETASSVDVLSWHDYSPTRGEIRAAIVEAHAVADSVHKPVFNSEIACIGRANPYDVALEEFQRAHTGWYLWELTITHEWGDVHGVFYPDGTVRDPSIVAAILGFFRNRGATVVLENPDRERWVQRAVNGGKAWLTSPDPDWQQGLHWAEMQANILEAAQLVAMREPPTRAVDLLRKGPPNIPALQALIRRWTPILEPYINPAPPAVLPTPPA